jgi:acylphosphatase
MPRLHALIHGRVQGVFFRASIIELARPLGLKGWVRNRLDGSVEVVAEGDAAAIDALRAYCKKGPPDAIVREFEIIDEPETGEFKAFGVRAEA